MQMINWMLKSKENYFFCIYGVEGKDYIMKDGRIKLINQDSLWYEWMFRNRNYQMFTPDVDQNFINTYNHWDDKALVSKSFGFRFDNSKVKDIELKLNEIAGKQFLSIRTGFVDFNTEYPKALKALKAAGIDQYVAEVNRQLKAYLAKQ